MTQGQILSSQYSLCKVPAVLGHSICVSQWNEILPRSPHGYYYNLTKHSEGPCCFLQYNSTGVTVGGWGAFPNRRLLLSPVSCSPQRALAWKRVRTQRIQYFTDSPLKHGREQAPAVVHAYNMRALQLLCSSLLWEVSSYGKQKAGGAEKGDWKSI